MYDLTKDEWTILNMCLLKEIGRHRMELLSDSYLMDDTYFDKKEKFTEALERLEEKIQNRITMLENEELK